LLGGGEFVKREWRHAERKEFAQRTRRKSTECAETRGREDAEKKTQEGGVKPPLQMQEGASA
jgi:hypothetical protein